MANVWTGGAKAVPQLNTLTPANVAIGNTFTVVVNNKSVSFVATAATVANVTAGLLAAIQASGEPEFAELTAEDGTTVLRLTGPDDGTPFTQTSSASGGTATLVTTATTAASGPNHWNVAANWSDAAVPVSSDSVVIDGPTPDILYGLAQGAVTLDTLRVTAGYTGTIGLPTVNESGYAEYRPTYLAIGATTAYIGSGSGIGSGRIKWDSGSGGTTIHVLSTGSGIDQGLEAFVWKGTGTNNINVTAGSVGLGVLANETSAVATLRVGGGSDAATATVRGGILTTVVTLHQHGGTVELGNQITTVNKVAGTLTVVGESTVTTLNNDGGDVFYRSNGMIVTLKTSNGAKTDFSRDPRTRTVTNCTIDAGSTLHDPNRTVTFTNPILLQRASLKDVDIDLGTHITIAVAAGP